MPSPMPAGAGEVADALRAAARLGPYFAITLDADGLGDTGRSQGGTEPAEEADRAWRPLPERDPGRLARLTDLYAERLGTSERRVAASILFQGLASRLWSPVVAAASRGVVPDLSSLHWRWAPGAPIALRLAEPRGHRAADTAEAADLVHDEIITGQLEPLRETLPAFVRLADGLLWGNAASALAGGLNVGPRDGARAALVCALLARPPLAGAGTFGPDGFVRRNCCLYYRVPPGGEMCGDCGLRRPPRRAGGPPPR
ncbi:(2Fe-2S)-binding protein [Actinomadura verrucosospora]|uniref:Ferric iron reductase n=1 Tax=Actinomadura verrucosospora TaxID=46165 RepID=A0A7D3VXR7_ACTVE|nr:(2Fe-2S)-binding protein [Actinomadura verrucosospora]QKG25920.1 Ferric iron reductase [Actinomadura verrucosospora]